MGRPRTLRQTAASLLGIGRHLWPEIRAERRLIALGVVALFAEVAFRLLEPWPLKFVFDRVLVTGRDGATPGGIVGGMEATTVLALAALALLVVIALRAATSYGNTIAFALVANRVLTRVRGRLYRHLQALSLSFHHRARGGDLVVRVVSDVGLLQDVIAGAVLPLIVDALILLGILALMFTMHWQLALLALAIAPLFFLRTLALGRRIHEAARKQRHREGIMAATAAESMVAMRTVQALSLEETFAKVFSKQNAKSLAEGVRGRRLSANLERTVDVLTGVATALVLWQGARLVMRGALTPGDLLVFLAYLKTGFRPVRDIAKYTGRLAKAAAAGERVVDLLARVPDVRDLPGAQPAPVFHGDVRFENIRFEYEPGQPVLDGVTLDIPAGTLVALVGPSGSGKSTLAALLSRLYDPQGGRVLIDGRDIREFTLESLRFRVGAVLQETLLFAATIRENIAYGRPDVTLEEVERAARLAHAHEFISAMPKGYDTMLGERGVTVSAGQRQRIAIARAAIRDTPILVLDEPTTGLDRKNARAVTRALRELAKGRTTLLITHDLALLESADTVVQLQNGRIVEPQPRPGDEEAHALHS